jgi:glycerol dehydrogenase
MARIIIVPSKYVQARGALKNISDYTKSLGKKILFIASSNGLARFRTIIEQSFENSGMAVSFETFTGECSRKEIDRIRQCVKDTNADVIGGIGGGKSCDTARAVAHYEHIPLIIIPTIASTDAPCSGLSVIYTDDGIFSEILLHRNPDLVLVDTDVITKAPVRLLVSGMGDALATYFEARACSSSNGNTVAGGKTSKTALALAQLCYDTLMEDGLKAKIAVENGVITKAVENIIEANIYLSGIGFESGGLAAAHSIHNGFTILKECHHLYHGEKVAFGTLVQLIMENSPMEEIEEVLGFCMDVGLPVTLEEMGIKEIREEDIREVASISCKPGESICNMPFDVSPDDVYAAIISADAMGKRYKE